MIDEAAVQRFLDAAGAQGLPAQVADEEALALALALARRSSAA